MFKQAGMFKQSGMFKQAWWLPGGHLQTLWPTLCRRSIKQNITRRERVELPDGDFIDLDWIGTGTGPIVLLLHGLEGSAHSSYIQGMLQAVHRQGWRGVAMHFRGCSGEMNRSSRAYHSGDTKDVAYIVSMLRNREPQTRFAAIGYSLGGNVLLKWLGELGNRTDLCAAVGVSVPFELGKTARRIQQGFSRVYQWHFLRSLRKKMQEKFKLLPPSFALPAFNRLRTLRDFDDQVTAPLHGFAGVDDYYTQSSSRQFLNAIATPTLIVQAKDDPFMTSDLIPEPQELSANITLELTEKGGHVGFITGSLPWRAQYWLEQRIPQFLADYIS